MNGSHIKFFGLDRQYKNLREHLLDVTDEVLSSGCLMEGPYTTEFENWLCKVNQSMYAITCHSGTQALEIIAQYMVENISNPNHTIYVPTLTYPATANAFINAGFNVKLIDCDSYGQTDFDTAYDIMSDVNSTLIGVGLYGESLDMPKSPGQFSLIEDGAQHWTSDMFNRLGTATTISFDPTKNLSASGNGGAIVTDSQLIASWARSYRNNGKHDNNITGTNSRMSELDCAHLLIRKDHLQYWEVRRKEIAEYYIEQLEDSDVRIVAKHLADHSWHKFVIDVSNTNISQLELQTKLREDGIETRVHYRRPLHEDPTYSHLDGPGIVGVASSLARNVLSLPIYPELTDSEVESVVERVLYHTS